MSSSSTIWFRSLLAVLTALALALVVANLYLEEEWKPNGVGTSVVAFRGSGRDSAARYHVAEESEWEAYQEDLALRKERIPYFYEQALKRQSNVSFPPTVDHSGGHPALTPMDPRYVPDPEWRNTSFPDIWIGGIGKAGTTHLYDLLVGHRDVVAFHEGVKEFCSTKSYGTSFRWDHKWDKRACSKDLTEEKLVVQKHLAEYHREHHEIHRDESRLTVNGCLNEADPDLHYRYLQPEKSIKFIITLRDPADLMWSSFNYFFLQDIDIEYFRKHPHEPEKYRTPSLFHDIVAAGTVTKVGVSYLERRRLKTVTIPRRLIKMVGRENVVFVKNEDMRPSQVYRDGGILDQLSEKLGISREGFGEAALSESSNTGGYQAQHRVMYPETRQLIYLQFLEECKVWATEFGVEYPDCLNILEQVKNDL